MYALYCKWQSLLLSAGANVCTRVRVVTILFTFAQQTTRDRRHRYRIGECAHKFRIRTTPSAPNMDQQTSRSRRMDACGTRIAIAPALLSSTSQCPLIFIQNSPLNHGQRKTAAAADNERTNFCVVHLINGLLCSTGTRTHDARAKSREWSCFCVCDC